MAKLPTLYVVVSGEYGEGGSTVSINTNLGEAMDDVKFQRATTCHCDITYIEMWEASKPKVGQPIAGRYDMTRTIPMDATGLALNECRGTR